MKLVEITYLPSGPSPVMPVTTCCTVMARVIPVKTTNKSPHRNRMYDPIEITSYNE